MRLIFSIVPIVLAGIFLIASYSFREINVQIGSAFAHEKGFPAKQLAALSPEGVPLLFKELAVKPDPAKLTDFEKKHGVVFEKGDLAGPLYLGSGPDQKVKGVAVFLDGRSARGDTEFGASINTLGRTIRVKVYSSPESSSATSAPFLTSLEGKGAAEILALRNAIPESESSKRFIADLVLKAIGRVEASFAKK